ncbi:MAG: signal peptide peptidase SppA, partial [Nitrospirae bacterium]|nr:signal peptide peptidase SppA [Nitrospirota bacterium]
MEKKRLLRTVLVLIGLATIAVVGVSALSSLLLDSAWFGGERVAVVRIEGVIVDSRDAIEELRKYRETPSVKAIVLRIDSPGGGVVASQEIHSEVLKTRADGRVKV